MRWILTQCWHVFLYFWRRRYDYGYWILRNWWTWCIIGAFGWIMLNKQTQFGVGISETNSSLSFLGDDWSDLAVPGFHVGGSEESQGDDLGGVEDANSFSNMDWQRGIGKSRGNRKIRNRRQKRIDYIKEYALAAVVEMRTYGIPASITLAQGLLESNAGESPLAMRNNNHFGIKCFSRRCAKGHCSNFNDDHHKDFFRIYKSPAESYREHSEFLLKPRYKKLFKLDTEDYESWAHGLKKAGYATDPRYAEKLISLIEDLNLQYFDRMIIY